MMQVPEWLVGLIGIIISGAVSWGVAKARINGLAREIPEMKRLIERASTAREEMRIELATLTGVTERLGTDVEILRRFLAGKAIMPKEDK